MIQPFIWMFKHKDFKNHFRYLLEVLLKFYVPAIILSILLYLFYKFLSPVYLTALIVFNILLYAAPFVCLQGYMWEMTENIISREWDIVANSVYNGKIKQVYKIELPELKVFRLIWRGIASIVANLLMGLPIILLFIISGLISAIGYTYFGTCVCANPAYPIGIAGAFLIYWFLIPAFLWNYAHRDSVVAVWNLRKAVYIAGNYTGKYILNSTVFCFFNFIVSAIVSLLQLPLSFAKSFLPIQLLCILLILYVCFSYLVYIYAIYVDAYLLGTIAPPHEG